MKVYPRVLRRMAALAIVFAALIAILVYHGHYWGMGDFGDAAWAQNGPTGGNAAITVPGANSVGPPAINPNGAVNGCSGTAVLASGVKTQIVGAGCSANFTYCRANQQGAAATPGGWVMSCAPTIAATVTGSPAATVTPPAVAIIASTANAAATVVWEAGPQ